MSKKLNIIIPCDACEKQELTKDEIGACKKLLGKDTANFYCLECLAQYLDFQLDELIAKIEQFKSEGCTLFQ